jgi:hypothetical protein
LFEKRAPILNNFEVFLAASAEAFKDHNKARLPTTKIHILWQGSCHASIYTSDFRLLASDINWDEEELMKKPISLGTTRRCEGSIIIYAWSAISQAMKYDNWLFQRRQDQRSWNAPKYNYSHSAASTTISNSHSGIEDMQIDAVRYKPLIAQEKKRCIDGGLCLYCGISGHKADNCPKNQHRHTFKMRSATISSNLQTENGEA